MLFSATYPTDIRKLCSFALRPSHEVVDTVGEEDTHAAEMVRTLASQHPAWTEDIQAIILLERSSFGVQEWVQVAPLVECPRWWSADVEEQCAEQEASGNQHGRDVHYAGMFCCLSPFCCLYRPFRTTSPLPVMRLD